MSDGFGTLAEAGWSKRKSIAGVTQQGEGSMAMVTFGAKLVLLFQPREGGEVELCFEQYQQSPENA